MQANSFALRLAASLPASSLPRGSRFCRSPCLHDEPSVSEAGLQATLKVSELRRVFKVASDDAKSLGENDGALGAEELNYCLKSSPYLWTMSSLHLIYPGGERASGGNSILRKHQRHRHQSCNTQRTESAWQASGESQLRYSEFRHKAAANRCQQTKNPESTRPVPLAAFHKKRNHQAGRLQPLEVAEFSLGSIA